MQLCKPIKDVPKVGDLSFVDFTDTTIGIRWTLLNYQAVTGYHITVVTSGQNFPILEDVVNSSVNYYTIRGLEPGINYDISVSTITDEAESVPSVITQQTQTGDLFQIGFLLQFEGRGQNPHPPNQSFAQTTSFFLHQNINEFLVSLYLHSWEMHYDNFH